MKVDKKKMVTDKVEPVDVMPPNFGRCGFLEQPGVGTTPTDEEVIQEMGDAIAPKQEREQCGQSHPTLQGAEWRLQSMAKSAMKGATKADGGPTQLPIQPHILRV